MPAASKDLEHAPVFDRDGDITLRFPGGASYC